MKTMNNVGTIVLINDDKCVIVFETDRSFVYMNVDTNWNYTGKLYVENYDTTKDKNDAILEYKEKYWGDYYE